MQEYPEPKKKSSGRRKRSGYQWKMYGYYSPSRARLQQTSAWFKTPDGREIEVTHVISDPNWTGSESAWEFNDARQVMWRVPYQSIPDLVPMGEVIGNEIRGELCSEHTGGMYGPFTLAQLEQRELERGV